MALYGIHIPTHTPNWRAELFLAFSFSVIASTLPSYPRHPHHHEQTSWTPQEMNGKFWTSSQPSQISTTVLLSCSVPVQWYLPVTTNAMSANAQGTNLTDTNQPSLLTNVTSPSCPSHFIMLLPIPFLIELLVSLHIHIQGGTQILANQFSWASAFTFNTVKSP